MNPDERYATELRARYRAVAPEVDADPAAIVSAGRRRRRTARGAGALAAVAAAALVAVGLSSLSGSSPGPAASPPPEESGPVSLWLSAERVPPGAELVAVLVAHEDVDLTFGVAAQVERWDGSRWRPHRWIGMCLDHWHCTAQMQPLSGDRAVQAIGLSATPQQPGPVERFSTDGLEPGWYRVSQTANEGVVARGVVEVAEGAADPAPLWPTDEPAISVQPPVLTEDGGTVTLTPLVPSNPDGSLSAEDVEAAVADLEDAVTLQRWTGETWVGTGGPLPLTTPDEQGYFEVTAEIPAGLGPGAYRLLRSGPDGDHTGNLWVMGSGADPPTDVASAATILEQYDGPPPRIAAEVEGLPVMGALTDLPARTLHVYTTAGQGCPTPPTGIEVIDGVVVVDADLSTGECDGVPVVTTYVVPLPEGVDVTAPPQVTLRDTRTDALIHLDPAHVVNPTEAPLGGPRT